MVSLPRTTSLGGGPSLLLLSLGLLYKQTFICGRNFNLRRTHGSSGQPTTSSLPSTVIALVPSPTSPVSAAIQPLFHSQWCPVSSDGLLSGLSASSVTVSSRPVCAQCPLNHVNPLVGSPPPSTEAVRLLS